jgi:hypothetical protein
LEYLGKGVGWVVEKKRRRERISKYPSNHTIKFVSYISPDHRVRQHSLRKEQRALCAYSAGLRCYVTLSSGGQKHVRKPPSTAGE